MTKEPKMIQSGKFATDALKFMYEKNITRILVLDKDVLIGTIRMQNIVEVGIVG